MKLYWSLWGNWAAAAATSRSDENNRWWRKTEEANVKETSRLIFLISWRSSCRSSTSTTHYYRFNYNVTDTWKLIWGNICGNSVSPSGFSTRQLTWCSADFIWFLLLMYNMIVSTWHEPSTSTTSNLWKDFCVLQSVLHWKKKANSLLLQQWFANMNTDSHQTSDQKHGSCSDAVHGWAVWWSSVHQHTVSISAKQVPASPGAVCSDSLQRQSAACSETKSAATCCSKSDLTVTLAPFQIEKVAHLQEGKGCNQKWGF